MKRTNILLGAVLFIAAACQDGYIDDIQPVQPGADESAPAITMTYPLEGTLIRVREDVTAIDVRFTVTDDIEIANIVVELNGEQIAQFNDFLDYRKAVTTFAYDEVATGEHTLSVTATDVAGKSTTQSVNFEKVAPYQPIYEGELFYMPFDGENTELVSITNPTRVGDPGFNNAGKKGSAYAGATDGYLTFPTNGLTNPEFSASFWYKLNAVPDRAGILVIGPPGPTNNNRTGGFRLFRENAGGKQRITLNVGNGTADSWFNSDAAYHFDPSYSEWIHVAFTISDSECVLYINGEVAAKGEFTGISWADCDILSIGSGAPRFSEWGHLSDLSLIDELRIFNKVLTPAEVQTIIGAD
jgi:hypothetical protein